MERSHHVSKPILLSTSQASGLLVELEEAILSNHLAGDTRTQRERVMSTPTATLRTERVPIELWLQIIRFSDCEKRDLADLALVSKFLAWVVQPLLFTDFTVTLLRVHLDGQVTKCQHTAYHTRMLERLQFLKSERIAHNVRSISIRLHSKAMHLDPEVLVGADEIVNEVFAVLAYLPHLKALHGHEVHLTRPHLALSNLSPFHISKVFISTHALPLST